MILRGRDLAEFELRVAGYQFPELKHNDWDSNWLIVKIRTVPVDDPGWQSTDPSLLTWEVEHLSGWFESLASGQTVEENEDFVEPNLRFEAVAKDEDTITIRVYFELESRPPWFFANVAGMNDLWIDLQVDSDDLRAAAEDLRRDLTTFPPRDV